MGRVGGQVVVVLEVKPRWFSSSGEGVVMEGQGGDWGGFGV